MTPPIAVSAIIACAAVEGIPALFVPLFGMFVNFEYCDPTRSVCFQTAMTMAAVI